MVLGNVNRTAALQDSTQSQTNNSMVESVGALTGTGGLEGSESTVSFLFVDPFGGLHLSQYARSDSAVCLHCGCV